MILIITSLKTKQELAAYLDDLPICTEGDRCNLCMKLSIRSLIALHSVENCNTRTCSLQDTCLVQVEAMLIVFCQLFVPVQYVYDTSKPHFCSTFLSLSSTLYSFSHEHSSRIIALLKCHASTIHCQGPGPAAVRPLDREAGREGEGRARAVERGSAWWRCCCC